MVGARLRALKQPGEVVTSLGPERLYDGTWWSGSWPQELLAGVLESESGYRFRPENLALAALLQDTHGRRTRVIDLGAGSGVLALICQYVAKPLASVAVEIQEQVAERLGRTMEAHGGQVTVVCGDLRDPAVLADVTHRLGGEADLIVMNPPWFPAGWGRPSSNPSTHASTHALAGDVADFLSASRRLLAPDGELFVVYDAARLSLLLDAAGRTGFRIAGLLCIPDSRSDRNGAPTRIWVRLGATGVLVSCLAGC